MNTLKRIVAFIIDVYIISFIMIIFTFFCGALIYFSEIEIHINNFNNIFIAVYLLILITKDIFGRSIGKKILKLQIVRKSGSNKPNVFMLIMRNITILIYPIELIFYFFVYKTKTKIGDNLAKTQIIYE